MSANKDQIINIAMTVREYETLIQARDKLDRQRTAYREAARKKRNATRNGAEGSIGRPRIDMEVTLHTPDGFTWVTDGKGERLLVSASSLASQSGFLSLTDV
jgi:hypothetical protein